MHRFRCAAIALAALLIFSLARAPSAVAFDPAVDRAGPLTVRIEAPATVDSLADPVAVRVLIESTSDAPLSGTVEIAVIDHWRAAPAEAVRFFVPARGTAAIDATLTPGERTFAAHYPIHAFVRFEAEGQRFEAHPIHVFEVARAALPPRRAEDAPPISWRAFELPAQGAVNLRLLPVRRAVVEVFGQPAETMPAGWQGAAEGTRATFSVEEPVLGGERRAALVMHPPWAGGQAGTVAAEWPLRLPEARPLRLRFAHGVTPTGEGDGVTFRVRVAPLEAPAGAWGETVFERHSAAKSWTAAEVDLSRFAGQAVRLQLESHPGPANNTGWDTAYWAEPTLSAGTPPALPAMPPAAGAPSRQLGVLEREGGGYEVRIWPGRRGLFDAVVGFLPQGGDSAESSAPPAAGPLYFRGFEVRALGDQIDRADSPTVLLDVEEVAAAEDQADRAAAGDPGTGPYVVRHRLRHPIEGELTLVGRLWIDRGVLRARMTLEGAPKARPWQPMHVEDFAAGSWSDEAVQVYAGQGVVVRRPEAFRLTFDGHRLSTSFVGFDFAGGTSLVQAVDLPPDHLEVVPARRHYSLHAPHAAVLSFLPHGNVWDAVRHYRETNDLTAAGGVEKLAGRFVFDLWGGRYGESRERLERSFRYGMTDAVVVWHNWQRWGYDYRLPEIFPPNPRWGAHEEMRGLAAACRRAGVLFAPHDNYIDYYPDAAGFSYLDTIAFHRDGQPVRAWLNEARGAQSYRYRADRIEPPLVANLQKIRDDMQPTAYFIDVWSSIKPYDYFTAEGAPVDRVFTRDEWARLFAWIRDHLGDDAPQISESGHDQLIGFLDGAQANHFRVGRPLPDAGRNAWCVLDIRCADAERIPWADAAHHDRFILHGAGYEGRYAGGLDLRLHGIYSDDYIATEVLTGRPGMVKDAFHREAVRKYWLTQPLARALSLRQIEAVEFVGGDLHRQHVRWSGGGAVWVNRGATDWQVAGRTLPPYGFLARVPDAQGRTVSAAIERCEGVIVEWSQAPEALYVNGRRASGGAWRIEPQVVAARPAAPRQVQLDVNWRADDGVPEGYRPFFHFVDAAGEILFQGGYRAEDLPAGRSGTFSMALTAAPPLPAPAETAAVAGDPREAGAAGDGTAPVRTSFELRAGLYHPQRGDRLDLAGVSDGQRRRRLGRLHVDWREGAVVAAGFEPIAAPPDPYRARQNAAGRPIRFPDGWVTADAMQFRREGAALIVTPLPVAEGAQAVLEFEQIPPPWYAGRPAAFDWLDASGKFVGRGRLAAGPQGTIRIEFPRQAFSLRLAPAGEE